MIIEATRRYPNYVGKRAAPSSTTSAHASLARLTHTLTRELLADLSYYIGHSVHRRSAHNGGSSTMVGNVLGLRPDTNTKDSSSSASSNVLPRDHLLDSVAKRPRFVGKRSDYEALSTDKRGHHFVGKRADSLPGRWSKRRRFVGKRQDEPESAKRRLFVGKKSELAQDDQSSEFEKRRMFVGKRPRFVGKRFDLNTIENSFESNGKSAQSPHRRYNSDSVVNLASHLYKRPKFVGKRRMFVGKRGNQDATLDDSEAKRPKFVGKRRMFVGKRGNPDATLDDSEAKRRMFVGKRDDELADPQLLGLRRRRGVDAARA